MSKLEYTTDGIYPEIRGIMDDARDKAGNATWYAEELPVLDDFPQVDYVRNHLVPELKEVEQELEDIQDEIQRKDARISRLTEDINNGANAIPIFKPERRKRMIL